MKMTVGDAELFYTTQGQGDPALVMHGGLGADHSIFLNTPFNQLSDRLQLVYYDHRCNGRSSCPGIETLSHDNLARDAEGLRAGLGLENITVIGHSYGGFAAMEYALRFPANLRRIVLITTAPSGDTLKEARKVAQKRAPELMPTVDKLLNAEVDSDEAFGQILTDLAPLYFYDFEPFEEQLADATKDSVFNAKAFKHSFAELMPAYDVRDKLATIEVPVLILCGRHDWITPVNQSELIHERIPNSELVIFEKSAHWVYIEEAELFLKTVSDWLERT